MASARPDQAAARRRTPPPPREANERVVTSAITAGWVVALIVVLIARDSLPGGERWWVWTCVTGVVLGLFGLFYVPYLQRSRAATAARRAGGRQDSPENDSNTVSSSATPGNSTRS